MPRLLRTFAPAFALLLSATPFVGGQTPAMPMTDHGQAAPGKSLASPAAMANASLGGKSVSTHYNTPSMRGRKVMGDLVPYGKVWRTGANPATSFTTEGNLMIGTLMVPAGRYTLYTLPAAPGTPWQLIVNKETGQWGTVYHEAQDLGRTPMHESTLPSPQEVMSISFEKSSGTSTQMHVRWDKADEWVEVKLAK